MNWILFALIGPALWAFVNHIDKYIISRYFTGRGVGSLVIFTSLSEIIISFLILIFARSELHLAPMHAVMIGWSGALLVASFIPYLHALQDGEASWASSLFQLIPVFGYFLGLIFLHEQLSFSQLFASLLIVGGAVTISLDLSETMRFRLKPFLLMALSAFMISVNALIFKMIALEASFWGTAFWEYIGGMIFGIFLFQA